MKKEGDVLIQAKKRIITRTLFQNPQESGDEQTSYLGVFNNLCSYQVMVRVRSKAFYMGQSDDPKVAAYLHDILKIQHEGMGAKVNFQYSGTELLAILHSKCLVDIRKQFYEDKKADCKNRRKQKITSKESGFYRHTSFGRSSI